MNIDTLRKNDNTFRNAQVIDIERCLNAGHTTHLQTERGTMAFRPSHDGGFVVSRCVPGEHQQHKNFSADERTRIIRCALNFLNGRINSFDVNDSCEVYANQGERSGYVLAVIGDEILVEYEMPGTTSGRVTSALVTFEVLGNRIIRKTHNYSYNAVPKRWLRAIKEAGMTNWIGLGQRSVNRIAFPDNI